MNYFYREKNTFNCNPIYNSRSNLSVAAEEFVPRMGPRNTSQWAYQQQQQQHLQQHHHPHHHPQTSQPEFSPQQFGGGGGGGGYQVNFFFLITLCIFTIFSTHSFHSSFHTLLTL